MAIDLSVCSSMPAHVSTILGNFSEQLREAKFLEELLEISELRDVVVTLDEVVKTKEIVVYHYTRNFRETLMHEGLSVKSGTDRRKDFLEQFKGQLSQDQIQRIRAGWAEYFNAEQNGARDGRIWFNLTPSALTNGGASPLLSHFGGEMVYMPFSRDHDLSKFLGSIGEPLIVRAVAEVDSLKTFGINPWGKTWLSTYHNKINPDAIQADFDVYTERPIPPECIQTIEVVSGH